MNVVVSGAVNEKKRIYHKKGCPYEKRIKPCNRLVYKEKNALKKNFKKCKCCNGFKGDILIHKGIFDTEISGKKVGYNYQEEYDSFYVWTAVGFWKIYKNKEGKYLLFHRNTYSEDMDFKFAIHGNFHRQTDVNTTEDFKAVAEYIISHDRAKLIINKDYKKLPQSTKQQKKYFDYAKKKSRKNSIKRVYSIFDTLEKSNEELKKYSFC